jgi:hypothetical protein
MPIMNYGETFALENPGCIAAVLYFPDSEQKQLDYIITRDARSRAELDPENFQKFIKQRPDVATALLQKVLTPQNISINEDDVKKALFDTDVVKDMFLSLYMFEKKYPELEFGFNKMYSMFNSLEIKGYPKEGTLRKIWSKYSCVAHISASVYLNRGNIERVKEIEAQAVKFGFQKNRDDNLKITRLNAIDLSRDILSLSEYFRVFGVKSNFLDSSKVWDIPGDIKTQLPPVDEKEVLSLLEPTAQMLEIVRGYSVKKKYF